jgi:hypothetical protein
MSILVEVLHDLSVIFYNRIKIILLCCLSEIFSAPVHDEIVFVICVEYLVVILVPVASVNVALHHVILEFKLSFELIEQLNILVVHFVLCFLWNGFHLE